MRWLPAVAALAVLVGTIPAAPREAPFWDTVVKLQVATNFAQGLGMIVGNKTPMDELYAHVGRDGRRYSYYPPLACLAWLPTYWLKRLGGPAMWALPTLLALAGLAALLVAWARRLGIGPVAATAGALAACFATTLWPSCTHEYDSIAEALGLATLFWAAAGTRRRDWFIAGLALGACFCTRQTAAMLAVPALVLIALQKPGGWHPILQRVALVVAGGLPGLAATAAYNVYRWGSMFWLPGSEIPPAPFLSSTYLLGVASLLVSPGKGLLWYSPPLIAVLALLRPLAREWRAPLLALAAWLGAYILLLARTPHWPGEWCWGPRYLMGACVAIAPLTWWIVRWAADRAPKVRAAVACAGLACVLLQSLAIAPRPLFVVRDLVVRPMIASGEYQTRPTWKQPAPADWGRLYWVPGNSAIAAQARAVGRMLTGGDVPGPARLGDWALTLFAPLAAALALIAVRRGARLSSSPAPPSSGAGSASAAAPAP